MFAEPVSAVTVSVGYADFLAETAKWNRPHLTRWTVVTSPDDAETREVCRRFKIDCLTTRDADRDGPFSKGRLVERGLQHLPAAGWVMHLDADIALPAEFRHDLARAHPRPEAVYGFDRVMVKSYERWQQLVSSGWVQAPYAGHPHAVGPPPGYEIGARWVGGDGWVPIGFCQLWHREAGGEEWRGFRVKDYPKDHGTACRTDVQHALHWDRRDRVLLPEVLVFHLESEAAATGANWRGRKTKRFGPPPEAKATGAGGPS